LDASNHSNSDHNDATAESDHHECGDCANESGGGVNFEGDVCESVAELSLHYLITINKVRKIVKMLNRSPSALEVSKRGSRFTKIEHLLSYVNVLQGGIASLLF
jgi:hypothetical protein